MKTQLTPLALLIPAVVLAQPTAPAQAPAPQPLNINVEQNALPNSADLNKAAAQALSKARGMQSEDDSKAKITHRTYTKSGGEYIETKSGGVFYCSSADDKTCTREDWS